MKKLQKYFGMPTKNRLLFTFLICIFLLNSCNEQGVDYDTSIEMPQPPASPDAINSSGLNDANIQQLPSPAIVPSDVAGRSGFALNPEHGQPGHRCDIAVGAPLNSPAQQLQPAPSRQLMPGIPANTGGSVTINPPHGQPGHDCAIPVGQPLKS
ncbi:MAG: hypothetical protein ABI325_06425 [Ginsengibacter sp.]